MTEPPELIKEVTPGGRDEDSPNLERATEALKNVRVVLVDPQYPGNIGSSARAMKNMGITDLRLVFYGEPVEHTNADARMMAMYAKDMLYRAPVCQSLNEAVADCSLVVGTTRRRGKYRQATPTVHGIAGRVLQTARNFPVALVFGPESFGLSNEHLRCCHELTSIPAHPEFASLNLAMAVMVVCYEIYRSALDLSDDASERSAAAPLATAEELGGMFGHMKGTLMRVGFLDKQNPERMMTYLRRLLSRADLAPRDVKILRGIFRQVNWAIDRVESDEPGPDELGEDIKPNLSDARREIPSERTGVARR